MKGNAIPPKSTYFLAIFGEKHRELSSVRVTGHSTANSVTSAALWAKLLSNRVPIVKSAGTKVGERQRIITACRHYQILQMEGLIEKRLTRLEFA